ncbi:putative nuclease HARBI1 [Lineus longissimus]|uniref:putative nuclease HARBI1 n=1 Tax=Lineus longissimus TaxID=88925 RepID=UPI002B4E397F
MGDYIRRVQNIERLQIAARPRVPRIRHTIYVDPDVRRNDEQFRKRYRFAREGFRQILNMLRDDLPEPIDNRGNPIPPEIQVKAALRFYATGNFQIVAGDLTDISQPSLSIIVVKVSNAIARKRQQFIRISEQEAARAMQRKFKDIAGFPYVIGCVDGVHVQIQPPPVENKEIYRCRKSFMSLNVQGICDADLRFINVVARWPGSTHDSRVFDNSLICNRFENNELSGLLLGDKGYPCRPFLMTPFRNPVGQAENRYNQAHVRTRSTVERTFGIWKKRFPCLKFGIRCKISTAMKIIVATTVLHNFARDIGDPYFEPDEDDDDEDELQLNDDALGNAVRQTIVQQYFL